MARIHDLIRQLGLENQPLADEIRREVDALSERRAFGLNFERHTPEQVELPGRQVRVGDKVHVLPPRGQSSTLENKIIWIVASFFDDDGVTRANLVSPSNSESTNSAAIEDLVIVAEFRDPIYPALVSTGRIERGGDKPFHTVINGENFHALEALLFTHRGKVDVIYIDPPYNTGARDWKYNNDYVEADDIYRHSKWLAFMERRLLLAKELLNPENAALIVTIDEKEYSRLALLLEQVFPSANIQMVTSVINRFGSARKGQFSRVEEYLFYVCIGTASIASTADNMLHNEGEIRQEVRWKDLRRGGANGKRAARPNLFYPVFVSKDSGRIVGVGAPLESGKHKEDVECASGEIAVLPLSPSGEEMRWGLSADTLRKYLSNGWVKWSKINTAKPQEISISYLGELALKDIEKGKIDITGYDEFGVMKVGYSEARDLRPMSVWNRGTHSAGDFGSSLLSKFLPGRIFPFPKSLYAVMDSLRFLIKDNRDAVVVDFFAGSGTTAHAVMGLNAEDGGRRQAILVTNNEVSDTEQKSLLSRGLRPGDREWEDLGICNYITKPRIGAAITGRSPEGKTLDGDYKFAIELKYGDGFEENAQYFDLVYENPLAIMAGLADQKLAPIMWMLAGSRSDVLDTSKSGWAISTNYGVLKDLDKVDDFLSTAKTQANLTHVFIFTFDNAVYEMMSQALGQGIEIVKMPEAYVKNFEQDSKAINR